MDIDKLLKPVLCYAEKHRWFRIVSFPFLWMLAVAMFLPHYLRYRWDSQRQNRGKV